MGKEKNCNNCYYMANLRLNPKIGGYNQDALTFFFSFMQISITRVINGDSFNIKWIILTLPDGGSVLGLMQIFE